MPDNKTVYAHHGHEYEALIAHEDHQGNILSALRAITPLEDRTVLDLGSGTGRLACMLAPHAEHVYAFDIAPDMLRVGHQKLEESGCTNWQLSIADHRYLPLTDRCVDLIVSGWSVSYLAVWNPDSWQAELVTALDEMKRVLRRGSHIVLFESLGTGYESPIRLDHLRNFYPWLDAMGFEKKWIRTDYEFESLDEAEYLARFFFGDELGDRVRQNNWVVLPECTGVWWKKV